MSDPQVQRYWKNKRGRWNVTVKRGCVAYTIICNSRSKCKATDFANELIEALKGSHVREA
jgi:hypothetical protein